MLGVHVHVASPEGYQLPHAVVQQATSVARHGARLRLFTDAADAVAGADAVYTDTWTSMGQEAEAELRRQVFAPYQVNDELMSLAKPGALFMHCLPAHRGEEVTAEVFESDGVGRVRSGREPAARPEGAAADAARAGRRSVTEGRVPMKKSLAVAACAIVIGSLALQAAQQRGQRGQRGGGEQPPATPAGQPAAPAAAPAKPLIPVAASTLAAHPETYYGERVTMTGTVEQTLGTLVFSVDQDKAKTLDQQILVLAPRMNAPSLRIPTSR